MTDNKLPIIFTNNLLLHHTNPRIIMITLLSLITIITLFTHINNNLFHRYFSLKVSHFKG